MLTLHRGTWLLRCAVLPLNAAILERSRPSANCPDLSQPESMELTQGRLSHTIDRSSMSSRERGGLFRPVFLKQTIDVPGDISLLQ